MIMDTERRGWERRQEGRQEGRLHSHVALSGWSKAPARVTALRWRDGGSAVSRPQRWSNFRNSPLHHVGAGRHLAGNARFSPVAKMLTAASCDPLAKKGKMGA